MTMRSVLVRLAILAPALASGHPTLGVAPPLAAELSLVSDGSRVDLDAERRARLVADITAYFESCHTIESVTGEQPSADDLQREWARLKADSHASLRTTGSPDSRHPSLRGKEFEVVVGVTADPQRSMWPVLTRDDSGARTLYTKCDGLQSLLLACTVRAITTGSPPSPDCIRLDGIRRDGRDPR